MYKFQGRDGEDGALSFTRGGVDALVIGRQCSDPLALRVILVSLGGKSIDSLE